MHILDLGLFKYMIDFTKMLLMEQCEGKVVATVEQRLAAIPRHPGLKIMKNGLDITRMTANELRNIMKVILFAIDNVYENSRPPGISNSRLSNVFYKFIKMYIGTRQESFSNESCNRLQVGKYIAE